MSGEPRKVINALLTIDSLHFDIKTLLVITEILMIILSLNDLNLRNLRIINICVCFIVIIINGYNRRSA